MRGIAAAVVALLAVLAFSPGLVSADAEVAPLDTGRMGLELNRARERSGLPPLARSRDLDDVAQRHTDRMAADGGAPFHSGDPAGGLTGWERVGEIVGRTDVHDPDWQVVLTRAFLDSSRHRDELLDARYLELGVGAAKSGDAAYVTGVFMRRRASEPEPPPPTTTTAPRRLAPSSVAGERAVVLASPPPVSAAPPAPVPEPLPPAAAPLAAAPPPAVASPSPAAVAVEPPPVDLAVAAVPAGLSRGPVLAGAGPRVNLFVVLVVGAIVLAAFGPPGRRRASVGAN